MYEDQTYENILDRSLARVASDVDKREGSVIMNAIAPVSAEHADVYIQLGNIVNNGYADTAVREFLILRCKERGIIPYEATKATLKGKFNMEIPIGSRFNLNELNYVATAFIESADGYFYYQMECETEGTNGNKFFGEVSSIEYIDKDLTGELTELLIPAEDEEDTEALRTRYLNSFDSNPFGGNKQDYVEKTDALDGVGGTVVIPVWNGGGTVKLIIINSDFGVASSTLVKAVQEAIDPDPQGTGSGIAPIGHTVTVVSAVGKTVSIKSRISFIQNFYPDDAIKKASGESELVDKVKADEVSAGFVVNSLTDYDYYVYNQSMTDDNQGVFTQVMTVLNQIVYCQKNGIDYASLTQAFNPHIDCHENILGKDMGSNYWYCYGLVMIIFMIIIMYGSMVATSVTQEKSNRTMEVLVTSVDTNLLFFAKVLAGAVAALIQSAVMLGTVLISYKINQDKWGGMLNMILDIPTNVLVVFALFGIGGFLFYTFIYGAMGALVSKTEDINKSAGGVQMVIMIVYFITLASLTNVDGIMIKVTSFLPVSSYSAMFARVAMGSVNTWEIVVSFIILVASIVVVGIIGAKIYRMGTLRYGNPIKLSNAFKSIKEN